MNQGKRIGMIVALLAVLAGGVWLFRDAFEKPQAPPAPHPRGKRAGPCPGKTLTTKMPDVYMRGMIEKDAEIRVVENWYSCNPPKRGDRVYFSPSSNMNPTVKVVEAGPGDKFEVVHDSSKNGWNLKVNGELVKREGKPYFFGGDQPPPLSLYQKPRKGVIGPDEVILFSAFPPGDLDSGILGLINTEDLLGKVIDKAAKEPES